MKKNTLKNRGTMTTKKTIIIGDIHGCFDELQELLSKTISLYSSDPTDLDFFDRIISIGDLVDRGPKPFEVVRFFRDSHNTSAILGNHEDKHIRIASGELQPSYSQVICKEQLKEHYDESIAYFSTLPLYDISHNFWIVHAGVVPETSIEEQPRKALLRGKMPWMKNAYDKSRGGWWEYYQGNTPVIYGHYFHRSPHIQNNTYGIDTGCCHGDYLTAMILPERRLVQVKAAKDHWKECKEVFSYVSTVNKQ
jgi:serine/threonine protein phosphatase 1